MAQPDSVSRSPGLYFPKPPRPGQWRTSLGAEAAAAYRALPNKANTPILCELEPSLTQNLNADIWAPRWTLGTQNEQVKAMQAQGRLVFVWTLDDLDFIEKFVNAGHLDGILSNYSVAVAYYHYSAQ